EEELELPPAPPEFEKGNASLIEGTIDINIGMEEEPKILKLGSSLTLDEIEAHKKVLKETFEILFTFSYKEMMGITPDMVVHNLVTKPDAKPMKQKSRTHEAKGGFN
ncbi:hypothetical protein KI387_006899, partial [Taxus chinensis]